MTTNTLPLIILALVMILSMVLWGRHAVLRRREEQELRPYRDRIWERTERRQREREERKRAIRQEKDRKRPLTTKTTATVEEREEEGELMSRLRNVCSSRLLRLFGWCRSLTGYVVAATCPW
jgi:hypothetical protein